MAKSRTSYLSEFHSFPLLPTEIREQIWCLSLPPAPSTSPFMALYDAKCWTAHIILHSFSTTNSNVGLTAEDEWELNYDHNLLPSASISVSAAFVNYEAHAIACAWLAATPSVRYSRAAGFHAPFDPERDALYVSQEMYEAYHIGWRVHEPQPGGRNDYSLTICGYAIKTVAFDQRLVEENSAYELLRMWPNRTPGLLERLLIVVGKDEDGQGENWTWRDPPGARTVWKRDDHERNRRYSRDNDGEDEQTTGQDEDGHGARDVVREFVTRNAEDYTLENLKEIRPVIAMRE
ncbi:hypothetical protein K461DRAFT_283109 [Myriangium duriaei CBS 260.36]|uniref:2EXR domain-containing protein n=1 Tax=Myriangium duriaei CBS 260.36 TaxID=1168546 RepID=A0A9P4IUI6_9PEZI|nr:hypothetical protein K461DRAFT_283109 [Myriangium duriaei CBS 260.36]